MAGGIEAIIGSKMNIQDDVEEMCKRKVMLYGGGASMIASKKHIGKKAIAIIFKDLLKFFWNCATRYDKKQYF